MSKHRTLILDRKDVYGLVDTKSAIKVVEYAFGEYGRGRTQMPPKIYLHLDEYSGDFRAMPAYVERLKKCALKWVNVHPGNSKFGLPSIMALIVLSDPKNGFPLCVMEGAYATALRTGAAGAVAAKYLARKNSKVVGLVGCGAQARTQLFSLKEFFNIKEVRVWGKGCASSWDFIREIKRMKMRFISAGTVKDCVKGADIVVTTTPSRRPIVRLEWLKEDAHINAIGADAKGKEELDPRILKRAKIVVDSWEQASHSGEINVPLAKGMITRRDIYSTLGDIVAGRSRGRGPSDGLTVFDSTGLAIQDVAIADLIYRTAVKKKIGRWVRFV